ncbi:Septation ring formation regulator EzrA [Salix suchowensis]|nr:Septation ring formation regulator EzrA [Salix suchowensis]
MAASPLQSSGMLSREQLLYLFNSFSQLTSQPDVKKRIADAVNDKQEAVAATTAIQESIFLEMGVDPSFGISCLGKVNAVYENDQELMICFYKFVANEEMACNEAEHGPDEFAEKMHYQQKLQEQQLEMLKYMRKFHLDDQSAILEKLRQEMENANFEDEASVLSPEQIQESVQRRVSPLFQPRNMSMEEGGTSMEIKRVQA